MCIAALHLYITKLALATPFLPYVASSIDRINVQALAYTCPITLGNLKVLTLLLLLSTSLLGPSVNALLELNYNAIVL